MNLKTIRHFSGKGKENYNSTEFSTSDLTIVIISVIVGYLILVFSGHENSIHDYIQLVKATNK